MAVSKHQFQLLSEMGIELWQPKTAATSARSFSGSGKESGKESQRDAEKHSANKPEIQTEKNHNNIIPPDFDSLKGHPLFHDIILSVGLSIGEVTATKEHLDLGLLHWQFTPEQLGLSDKVLTTPPIQVIAASGKLKRQLWQLLQEHSL